MLLNIVSEYLRSIIPDELLEQIGQEARWYMSQDKRDRQMSKETLNQLILAALRHVVIDLVRRDLI